ncbi:uncharacterized protein METZ01_LOCUS180465, partial [marine metagenome]
RYAYRGQKIIGGCDIHAIINNRNYQN